LTGRAQGEVYLAARAALLALLGSVSVLCARPAFAQEPILAVVPVARTVVWDATLEVEVLLVNRRSGEAPFPLGETIRAHLSVEGESWPVTLIRDGEGPQTPIPTGGFAAVRYHAMLPPQAHGRATLTLEDPAAGGERAVIDIVGGGTAGPSTAGAWNGDFDHRRLLSDRLSIYEPIYIVAGTGSPAAKFQVSFKYRLLDIGAATDTPPRHTLQLAYTQRSLWELGPFYDTSYMPEVMYQWLEPPNATPTAGSLTWLGLQSGLQHESNGKSGSAERSANILYVRPLLSIGRAEGWHALLEPEVWFYILGLSYNPDLYIYRGNSALRATVGKGSGISLAVTVLPGEHFAHGSRQLDLSIPVHVPVLDLSAYLMVQYFDGYAESLIAYQQHTQALRGGLQIVR
jgi:outer membrane phospholipase A